MNDKQLPEGWSLVPLNQASKIIMGQSPPSSTYNNTKSGLPFYQGKAEFGDIYPIPRKWCSSPKKIAIDGDILLSVRAPIGPTNICFEKSCIGRGLAAIRPKENIPNKYLYYYFKLIEPALSASGKGSTFTAIKKEALINTPIPLAPVSERKQIVNRIEKLENKLNQARANLDQIPSIFRRLRLSILSAACTGKLTTEWRKKHPEAESASSLLEKIMKERIKQYETEAKMVHKSGKKPLKKPKNLGLIEVDTTNLPELPNGWEWVLLENIASNDKNALKAGPFGSSIKKSMYVPSGYKVYGQEQVIGGDINYGNYYINEKKFNELKSCEIAAGDLLISLVGTVGKVLIVPEIFKKGIINPRLVKISLNNHHVNPEYIKLYLESSFAKSILAEGSHGGTMDIINLKILKSLPIPLPPTLEQIEIIGQAIKMGQLMSNIEQSFNNAAKHLNHINQSILSKAFKGELL